MTFTEQMAAAPDADAGRGIWKALDAAIHDLEVFHAVPPTVGVGGSGFGYRGFTTVTQDEWRRQCKFVPDLRKLVDDGYAMAAPWCKLLAAETREQLADLDACMAATAKHEPEQGSLFSGYPESSVE